MPVACYRRLRSALRSLFLLTLLNVHVTSGGEEDSKKEDVAAAAVIREALAEAGWSTMSPVYHEYCVVGAGPSGLQMAYYLHGKGRDYIVFERGHTAGMFFTKYPRHDTLISINKRNTGRVNREFNLRHDWNSLLSNDESLLVKHYSKDFLPHRTVLLKYLEDYRMRFDLAVQFNTNISNIRHYSLDGDGKDHVRQYFTMMDQKNNNYACHYVIMANGVDMPISPSFRGAHLTVGYESMPLDPEHYEGASVLILGRGNTAFEVAQSIYGHTAFIHMVARSRIRLSWSTHYVGDLRAVNNGLLDTYQLKSLDGVVEAPVEELVLVRDEADKMWAVARDAQWPDNITDHEILDTDPEFDNIALREGYDVVIRCLGFSWDRSALANSSQPGLGRGRKKKYPNIGANYGARNVSGLYFAGTNTHSLDQRKSAGGFIHGFRYTTRALHRYLENVNHGNTWPHVTLPITGLMNHIIKRINEASGTYQMFSVLADIIVIAKDTYEVKYFEEFPVKLIAEFAQITGIPAKDSDMHGIIVCVMEYGRDFSKPGADTFRSDRATIDPLEGHKANFLHPVLYYYKQFPTSEEMRGLQRGDILPRPVKLHHIVEDFHTTWLAPHSHILPLRRWLEWCVDSQDLRTYTAQECYAASILAASPHLPLYCRLHYEQGQGVIVALNGRLQLLAKEVLTDNMF